MMEVSERSVLIGCMKLKYAIGMAPNFDNNISAWCQCFGKGSSTRAVANCGGMEFHEADVAMVRDVENDR